MSKGRLPVLIEAVRTMRGPPAGDVDRKPHVVAAGELHPVAVSVLGDSFDFSLEIGRELNYRHRRFPPLSAIRFQPPLTRLNHATTSRCFSNFAPFGQTIITLVLPPSLTRWALGSFTFSMVPSGQRTRKWPFNGGSLRAAMGFLDRRAELGRAGGLALTFDHRLRHQTLTFPFAIVLFRQSSKQTEQTRREP